MFDMKLQTRRHRSARLLVGAGVAAIALVLSAVPAFASSSGAVSITSQAEGSLKIEPGDYVSAGYQFTIPGWHAETVVGLFNAVVTIPVSCTSGSGTVAGNIVVDVVNSGPFDDPAGSSRWYPTNTANESDPSAFQGSVVVPAICGVGKAMYSASQTGGATLTGTLQSTASYTTNVQFHYRDPNALGRGNIDCSNKNQNPSPGSPAACGASWSATSPYTPAVVAAPLPADGALGALALLALLGITLGALNAGARRRRVRLLSTRGD
jgi:hypothetical protein